MRRRLRSSRGQAAVEYVLVCLLIISLSLMMLKKMLPAARKDIFKAAIECAISDVCKGVDVTVDPLKDQSQ